MSFSFSASGTKAQTLATLGELVHQHDSHSKQTADLVTSMVDAGPAETTIDGQVHEAVFSISAYGHSSAGHDLPSLGVSFSCSWRVREVGEEKTDEAAQAEEAGPGL